MFFLAAEAGAQTYHSDATPDELAVAIIEGDHSVSKIGSEIFTMGPDWANHIAASSIQPLIDGMWWVVMRGFWFGLSTPGGKGWFEALAFLIPSIAVGAFLYAHYAAIKHALRWFF